MYVYIPAQYAVEKGISLVSVKRDLVSVKRGLVSVKRDQYAVEKGISAKCVCVCTYR